MRSRKTGHRWIGLLAAVLLLTGGGLVTMTARAVPAHAWDIEDCTQGIDCPGDPGGGSLGDTDECLWESCGQIDDLGGGDPGDECADSSCDDGQNPPVQQCQIIIKPDGTLVCIDSQPGPDDPPPPDCLSDGSCPNPVGEEPIDPDTCSPAGDGPDLFFNQDNFTSTSLPTDPFPDMDPLYNDGCPPMETPPAPARQFGATDVAFGDSFISGEGAGNFQPSPTGPNDTSCDVSPNAWPNLVYGAGNAANVLNSFFGASSTEPFENWACTGAVVSQIQSQINAAKQAGLLDFNSSGATYAGMGIDTQRVEISAGGNDLGFGTDLFCAWHPLGKHLPDDQRSTDGHGHFCIPTPAELLPQVNALVPRLISLYESVDTGASGPTVDVVGYPQFFPAGASPACGSSQTGITRTDQINTNNDVIEVNDAIRRAAAAAGVNYVDFTTALQGATLCDNPPGVNTVGSALLSFNKKGPFHPNAIGHRHLADAYMRANFFPQAGASPATPADGTLVGDRAGDAVYVAAGGALFPFANQAELSASAYKSNFITLEPSLQVATQLETAPALGTLLKDAATGVIYAVSKENPEGTDLIPLQPTNFVLPAITVPDEALAGYPIADASFVKVAGGDGTVYEMVGGAPVPVTDPSHVGGTPIIGTISSRQFNEQAQSPADGTFVKNASGTVYEFAGGAPIVVTNSSHVTGEPSGIQEIDQTAIDDAGSGGPFNHINQYPANGTFVTATQPGTTTTNIYEFAGGAPIAVSDWSHVGGPPSAPIPSIDQTALDLAGTGGAFNHVRQYPADGTYVTGQGAGAAPVADYVFAGGAPIPITDWTHLGGSAPGTPPDGTVTVDVDETALDNAGSAAPYNHVLQYPADGTIMLGNGSNVFVVAGGAPTFVDFFEDIGGARPAVSVDQNAIDNAGSGGIFNHLRFRPADGTILESFGTGHVFVVAGGAPLRVSSLKNIDKSTVALGGSPPAPVFVDEDALEKAGSGGFYNHLSFHPADNTLLSLLAGNSTNLNYFVVAGGAPIYVPDVEDIGGARGSVVVDEAAIDGAGSGGDWLHLSLMPANGTLIESFDTGSVYQIENGVPILDCAVTSATTLVAQDALTKAGTGGFFNHLKPLPSPAPPPCPAPPPSGDPGPL